MIDILCPTHKRPQKLMQMVDSAKKTADKPEDLNFIFYVDNMDDLTRNLINEYDWQTDNITWIIGKQLPNISMAWNVCYRLGQNPIVMHCADDIIFQSNGWDTIVKSYFDKQPICMVYGQDGHQNRNCATHSFTSRKAAEIISYFVPPYFEADFNDIWLMQIYQKLCDKKKVFIHYDDKIITKHLHVNVDEKYNDDTYKLAEERRPRASIVWNEKNHLIPADTKKLKDYMIKRGLFK